MSRDERVRPNPADISASLDRVLPMYPGDSVIPLERVHRQEPGLPFRKTAEGGSTDTNCFRKPGVDAAGWSKRDSSLCSNGIPCILSLCTIDGSAVAEMSL